MDDYHKLINNFDDEDVKLFNEKMKDLFYFKINQQTHRFNNFVEDFSSLNSENQQIYLKFLVTKNNYSILYNLIKTHNVDIFFENNVLLYLSLFYGDGRFKESSYDFVKLFIDAGYNVSDNDNLAIKLGASSEYRVLKLLIESGANVTVSNNLPIRRCMNNGSLEKVKLLIDNGADLHCRGEIVFKLACYKGYEDIVNFCINDGVDVNIDNGIILKLAINWGHTVIIEKLIENGINLSYVDKYDIYNLIKYTYSDTIKLLLKYGVDFSQVNELCHDLIKKDKDSEDYKVLSSLMVNGISPIAIIYILDQKE
ncbi:ankyrin repeat protein [Moumouvirus australiensis]|uniref:Ankyrin repeat protein n=1 Tax=Moumouvirus australiensis TaxID=2109587 RepID=A0A2P1EMB0_9VIRU|nr:ankyrin repeat protein [Moumouvirus australiensis]AVL95019.1 ankyrin repeat protein [Moumouvirus australiensis]